MSYSIEYSRQIIESMELDPIPNFVGQVKAKQLLREVREEEKNYPLREPLEVVV